MSTRPRYTYWEGLDTALRLGVRALEEIRMLARLPGPVGPAGKDGTNGLNGKDGVDGLNGKDGADGRDGKDGIGFDDIEEHYEDDGRFLVRQYLSGGVVMKEFRHQTRMAIWRGTLDTARTYLPGDMVTWRGNVWHCNQETTGKIDSDFWSLAVRKGRDASDDNGAK